MSFVADLLNRGYSPRQHHDFSYDEDKKLVTYSCRIIPSSEPDMEWEVEAGTMGDDIGWTMWRARTRKCVGWSPSWSVVVASAIGNSRVGVTTASRPDFLLQPDAGAQTPDNRFQAKKPFSFPTWASRYPNDWTGTVSGDTNEIRTGATFHPDFLGLVASNRGATSYSTKVIELDGTEIDKTLVADLSSIFSVEEIVITKNSNIDPGKVVALQLGETGQGHLNSAGLMALSWGSGGGKALLCQSGYVGGPWLTPSHADLQIGEAKGGTGIFPAAASTDMLFRTYGTNRVGPFEFHGDAGSAGSSGSSGGFHLQGSPGAGTVGSMSVQGKVLFQRGARPRGTFNQEAPGTWQIWVDVPYVQLPPSNPGVTRVKGVPLIAPGGSKKVPARSLPTGRQGVGGTPGTARGGGGPGGQRGAGPGPGGGRSPNPAAGQGQIATPGGKALPKGGVKVLSGGGVKVNKRSPLSGFGIPAAGGAGGGVHAKTQHTNNARESLTDKRRRQRAKKKAQKERREQRRKDREARRKDRRDKNPRGRKAKEAKEARRKAKEDRKASRKKRREERREKRREKQRKARKKREERQEKRRKEKEKRREKARESAKKRRKAGQNPGIPLFPKFGQIGQGRYSETRGVAHPNKLFGLGGFHFLAQPFRTGEQDLTDAPAGSAGMANALKSLPQVGGFVAYGTNPTGSSGDFTYTDRKRGYGGGSIALISAGYDFGGSLRGETQPAPPAEAGLIFPSGVAHLDFGTMDTASGGMHSGARCGSSSIGYQMEYIAADGSATGDFYRLGEGGHRFDGKVDMNGRLDPWTCEFTDRTGSDIPAGNIGIRYDSAVNSDHLLVSEGNPQNTHVLAYLGDIGTIHSYPWLLRRDTGNHAEGSAGFYDRESLFHFPGWTIGEDTGDQDNTNSMVTGGEEKDGGVDRRTSFFKIDLLNIEEGRDFILDLRIAVPQWFSAFGSDGIRLRHKISVDAGGAGGAGDTGVARIDVYDPTTASDTSVANASRTVAGNVAGDTNYQELQITGATLDAISNNFAAGDMLHLRITLDGAFGTGGDYPTFHIGRLSITFA